MKTKTCPFFSPSLASCFTFFVLLLIACVYVLGAEIGIAQTPTAQTPIAPTPSAQTPAPPNEETKAIVAKVSSINPSGKTIELVTADGQKLHFDVTDATKVTKADQSVSLYDVTWGSTVGVRYALQSDGKSKLLALRTDGEIPPPDPFIWPRPKHSPVKS